MALIHINAQHGCVYPVKSKDIHTVQFLVKEFLAPGIAKERICQLINIASYGHFLLNTVEQILVG